MKLTKLILSETEKLTALGYQIPRYDAAQVARETLAAPEWVHFGAGNILRSFLAQVVQQHLNQGAMRKGIVAVEGFDLELVDKIYRPYDCLGINVVLLPDGSVEKTLTAGICGAYKGSRESAEDWQWLQKAFGSPGLKMVSFTITEKGYNLTDGAGQYTPAVEEDFRKGPACASTYIGKLVALLNERYLQGAAPIALVSMDNCSRNGERLQRAVQTFAEKWLAAGLAEQGFVDYLKDPKRVSYPFSMIDKITPRPDAKIQALLEKDGFEGMDCLVTAFHTYAAPFVNAEKPQYLVIEDDFPAGCPLPQGQGVYFAKQEQVMQCETMKVTTCLNPLHTALAVMGCLLGYELIADEMQDAELTAMVERLGYVEGLPVVVHPGIIDPRAFLEEVLKQRLPNPYMPDTPQRIASDTSQKIGIRFGETVKAYKKQGKDMEALQVIPMVQAAWLRYLLAVDDSGKPFAVSPDPMAEALQEKLKGICWNQPGNHHEILAPILSDKALFGVDLYDAGLGERAEAYFEKMLAGEGAVRKTLCEVCKL